jgi:hypothetical protein
VCGGFLLNEKDYESNSHLIIWSRCSITDRESREAIYTICAFKSASAFIIPFLTARISKLHLYSTQNFLRS